MKPFLNRNALNITSLLRILSFGLAAYCIVTTVLTPWDPATLVAIEEIYWIIKLIVAVFITAVIYVMTNTIITLISEFLFTSEISNLAHARITKHAFRVEFGEVTDEIIEQYRKDMAEEAREARELAARESDEDDDDESDPIWDGIEALEDSIIEKYDIPNAIITISEYVISLYKTEGFYYSISANRELIKTIDDILKIDVKYDKADVVGALTDLQFELSCHLVEEDDSENKVS
ncbi:hypothetical protein ABGV42_01630 [Paenibacillus pabuli]|uniref:hypothetical protein n=1 Tax=Paenibacillus pabuli TaxID=1472 RepID=UPI0032421690